MLDPVLEEFLRRLVDAIAERNADCDNYSDRLDAPFIISSLYQRFRSKAPRFDDFIEELEEYPNYEILIDNATSKSEENLFAIARVILRYSVLEEHYYYQIKFYYDNRYLGYCHCTPDMSDYREDRGCCGHNCDAEFCSFKLEEVIPVDNGNWVGDEHDYWDFEDDFYEESTKRKDEKENQERKSRIEMLRKLIAEDTERLNKLLEEDAEFDKRSREGA